MSAYLCYMGTKWFIWYNFVEFSGSNGKSESSSIGLKKTCKFDGQEPIPPFGNNGFRRGGHFRGNGFKGGSTCYRNSNSPAQGNLYRNSGKSSTESRTNYTPNYNNQNRGAKSKFRSKLFCDFCQTPGHNRDRCFKLYPPQINEQNEDISKGKVAANVHGHVEENIEQSPVYGYELQDLTKEQYGQLLRLLDRYNSENSGGFTNGAANFAGTFNEEVIGVW